MFRRNFLLFFLTAILLAACNLIPTGSNAGVSPTPTFEGQPAPESSATPIPLPPSPTPTLPPEPTGLPAIPDPAEEAAAPAEDQAQPTPTAYPFGRQPGSPVFTLNFAHPELACNWMGVAGQVFDLESQPLDGILVEAGGTLNGEVVLGLAITGSIGTYGPGSYELQLSNRAIASQGTVWLRLMDFAGNQLSDIVSINTSSDCGQNLILLNFSQRLPLESLGHDYYLPLIIFNAAED